MLLVHLEYYGLLQFQALTCVSHWCMFISVYKGSSQRNQTFLKIYCFTYNLIKLVTFKVLPSTLDTPLPTFFPFPERALECVLRDGVKVPYRIFFCLLYRLKSATF